jgi:ApbE superfamily uncharacterized protein (UPF0280 family)
MGPTARLLPCGTRLHLQHGPSDLIVMAEGDRAAAFRAATARFETIIAELVAELDDLRQVVSPLTHAPMGAVARRMHSATRPLAATYVTRMAAVAGAIADEVLEAMVSRADLRRAYVNNGGDIALYLTPGTEFRSAIRGHDNADLGRIEIRAGDPVRGIATSGRHGCSLSLGIADSVTVLAPSAAQADVAATLIANAVDLPGHPAIRRRPARDVVEDSDLGDLPAVVGCDALAREARDQALANGLRRARRYQAQGQITGAALVLQGHAKTTTDLMITETTHA